MAYLFVEAPNCARVTLDLVVRTLSEPGLSHQRSKEQR